MAKKEAAFQSEVTHSIKELYPNVHVYKIPDPNGYEARKNIKRPYDEFVLIQGMFFALELKQMSTAEGFAFDKVEQHQEWWLMNAEENGGTGFLIIFYKFELTKKQRENLGLNHSKYKFGVYFRIDDYIELKDKYLAEGRKSIPFEYFFESQNKLSWIPTKGVWDINKMFDSIFVDG